MKSILTIFKWILISLGTLFLIIYVSKNIELSPLAIFFSIVSITIAPVTILVSPGQGFEQ